MLSGSIIIPNEEAAALLDCGEERIREMLVSGDLPGLKPGKAWVIPRKAFEEAVNELARTQARMRQGLTPAPAKPAFPVVEEQKKPGRPRVR